MPDRDLTAGEVERLWGRDRAALSSCGARHGALVGFITVRDAGIGGAR